MKRSRFSEEQIVYAIRQAESGTQIGDLCGQLGVSEATSYTWKKQYARLGVSELRRLARRKRETPDSNGWWRTSRSISICGRRPCEKKSKARTPSRTGPRVSRDVSGQLPAGLSVGAIRPRLLVSTESREGSNRPAAAYSRSGSCSASDWPHADLGVAAA